MSMVDKALHRYELALRAYGAGDYQVAVREARALLPELREARDRRAAEVRLDAIRLLLDAGELWWSTGGAGEESVDDALVGEAQAVAQVLGDRRSLGVAALVRGRHLAGADGLGQAVSVLGEAARLAGEAGDDVLLLDALTLQGHYTVGRSVAAGVALLGRAQEVADRLPPDRSPRQALRTAKLTCVRGVAEFDLGRFDTGEALLRTALSTSTTAQLPDLRASATNYLCQLLISAGRFEEAERMLTEELALLGHYAADSPHQAYNHALLGKARIEAGRPEEAVRCMRTAWELVADHGPFGIRTLIRNYLAELFIHPVDGRRALHVAESLLRDSVEECRTTGFQRSEVAALTLWSLVRRELDDDQGALAHSTEAVRLLEEAGGVMPALRGEEVYYVHSLGGEGGALEEARRIVREKAGSIGDLAAREVFLHQVPLNRAILARADGAALA